ncbi:MAG TPA: hypothetical protein VLG27_00015 [Candidatus Saccharimonadia bacterium]|nr:hypothetical protein [Candidatus Saccharimonadia bacterium]
MSVNNPSHETESVRRYKRRRLRDEAESILKKRGSEPLEFGPFQVRTADLRFEDGQSGQLVSMVGRIASQKLNVVLINIFSGGLDASDPMTTYKSRSPGDFTRSDVNPGYSGMPSNEEIANLSAKEQAARLFAGSIAAGTSQLINKMEGLDDHPITGIEADEIRTMLRGSVS